MRCHAALRLISAERDGALADRERAALDTHVATCPACRDARAGLAAAAEAWRLADRAVPAPDAEQAWHAIRREIRAGQTGGATRRGVASWLVRGLWTAVPIAGAAALALVLWTRGPAPAGSADGPSSWVQYVEVGESAGTPVVYVDEASGWVVVWAGESPEPATHSRSRPATAPGVLSS